MVRILAWHSLSGQGEGSYRFSYCNPYEYATWIHCLISSGFYTMRYRPRVTRFDWHKRSKKFLCSGTTKILSQEMEAYSLTWNVKSPQWFLHCVRQIFIYYFWAVIATVTINHRELSYLIFLYHLITHKMDTEKVSINRSERITS